MPFHARVNNSQGWKLDVHSNEYTLRLLHVNALM
jgi:hypothetical protein